MPYTFDPIFAVDPGNPANVAANAELVIFTPGDTLMSPLTLTTPDELPFANPVTTNGSGFAGAFVHESLGRVAWSGGGFTGFFTAYDDIKQEAVAARDAAVDAAVSSDSSAQSSAVSAQAALDAAALVDAPADQIMADTAANPATAFAGVLSATNARVVVDGPSGGDDHAMLQAQIDAAASTGKPLYLKVGTYLISASLVLPSNVTVEGFGPGTKIITQAGANSPVFVNSDTVNGNTNIIIRNLHADGNRANQTLPFSVIKMTRVRESSFENLWVRGGKRTEPYPSGHSGEGLEFVHSTRNQVRGGRYFDNDYDGIKLRTSHYTTISDVLTEDNGKGGVQLAYAMDTDEVLYASSSTHNTITNLVVRHSTGQSINPTVSPQTTGITFHSAAENTVTNLVVYGPMFGISTAGGDTSVRSNVVQGATIETRTTLAALALTSGTGNTYDNITIRPIDGASMKFFILGGSRNVLSNSHFFIGGGTGTWTDEVPANSFENALLWNMHDDTTWGGLTDNGTQTYVLERGRKGNYGFGIAKGFGGGSGVLGIKNASTVPTSNPTGGVLPYAEAGAFKARTAGGTVNTIAGEYVAPTGAYAAGAADRWIISDGSTITIGTPTVKGRVVTVKNIGATAATVNTGGGSLIDGAASISLAQWASATLIFTGSNWLKV